jgi:hypothetical protein
VANDCSGYNKTAMGKAILVPAIIGEKILPSHPDVKPTC